MAGGQDGEGWGHRGGIQQLREDPGVLMQGNCRGLRGGGDMGPGSVRGDPAEHVFPAHLAVGVAEQDVGEAGLQHVHCQEGRLCHDLKEGTHTASAAAPASVSPLARAGSQPPAPPRQSWVLPPQMAPVPQLQIEIFAFKLLCSEDKRSLNTNPGWWVRGPHPVSPAST